MTKGINFLRNAILGENVGAVARSSKFVIEAVLKNINAPVNEIIEYGAGDGVLTNELLSCLAPDGRLLAVELDQNFIDILKKIDDPRLTVVQGRMQDVCLELNNYGFLATGLVLSSVPFSLINKKEREIFVKSTERSLVNNGKFIIFHQYSKIMEKPLFRYFKIVKTTFEPRNILPCFIMCATKSL